MVLFVVTLSSATMKQFCILILAFLQELGYEVDVLEGVFDFTNSIKVNNKEVSDFMVCTWRKYDKVTEDYKLNIPVLQSGLSYSVRKVLDYQLEQNKRICESIVNGCIAELETEDPCEQAVQLHNCFVRRILYGPR
ncbi:hypothetical protein ILUMI_12214 [Ignelater luminosus]|uniref:Uncharacterized protein n=1 Tax=Ignelater luminosus TaxID=2038154 RepID=A0A8K0CUN7_IGNLU|nr:hypothetical protein ILUMI_12214 [Ignelater luminosus]